MKHNFLEMHLYEEHAEDTPVIKNIFVLILKSQQSDSNPGQLVGKCKRYFYYDVPQMFIDLIFVRLQRC